MDKFKISSQVQAIITFCLVILFIFPNIQKLKQQGDEKIYIWKSAYYANRLIRLDFSQGTDLSLNPGFDIRSFWAWEQPYGSHVIYALTMFITNTQPPALPFSYTDPNLQGPETDIPVHTLFFTRLAGLLCAAAGLALVTLRFGWISTFSTLILLAIPATRDSFSRAWAEGPLMLGFGLCAIAYKHRWFPFAIGVATAFKLTALCLWPLILFPGSCGKEFHWSRSISILIPPIIVSILTPVSWIYAGPLFLGIILYMRVSTWLQQSRDIPTFNGLFFPARYAWPIELMALLLVLYFVSIMIKRNNPIKIFHIHY